MSNREDILFFLGYFLSIIVNIVILGLFSSLQLGIPSLFFVSLVMWGFYFSQIFRGSIGIRIAELLCMLINSAAFYALWTFGVTNLLAGFSVSGMAAFAGTAIALKLISHELIKQEENLMSFAKLTVLDLIFYLALALIIDPILALSVFALEAILTIPMGLTAILFVVFVEQMLDTYSTVKKTKSAYSPEECNLEGSAVMQNTLSFTPLLQQSKIQELSSQKEFSFFAMPQAGGLGLKT